MLSSLAGWQEGQVAAAGDLLLCHARDYVEQLRGLAAPAMLDPDTVATATSYEACLLAVGCAQEAARRGGFALVRPPGHHALPARAMGFCLVNTVAVAARWAQRELGVARIAVLDWDVHHGNGTQAIFWDDPTVLYISLHQYPLYPGTGSPAEQDETTVNVPLRSGCGDFEYLEAFETVVQPIVARFAPELLLVSAGFDAHEADPLAGMAVTTHGFRELARRSAALAPRTAAVLEGGYNLETLPRLVEAALEGFSAS